MNSTAIYPSMHATYLGVDLDTHLSFETHVNRIIRNMALGIKCILSITSHIPLPMRLILLKTLVLSHINYSAILLNAIPDFQLKRLDRQVNWAIKSCYFRGKFDHVTTLRKSSKVLPTTYLINISSAVKFWELIFNACKPFQNLHFPNFDYLVNPRTSKYALRNPGKTSMLYNSFLSSAVRYFNNLPASIRQINVKKLI